MDLFNQYSAAFSKCRKYRYALWRLWDPSKPFVMFIGLNPSTGNEIYTDPTLRSVKRISAKNGYGGFYMLNCFPYVSSDPDKIIIENISENDQWLKETAAKCQDVVFAWGAFKIVSASKRDAELKAMFPKALCLGKTSHGAPLHPLYINSSVKFQPFL